jgi:hypothetical protein
MSISVLRLSRPLGLLDDSCRKVFNYAIDILGGRHDQVESFHVLLMFTVVCNRLDHWDSIVSAISSCRIESKRYLGLVPAGYHFA